MHWVSIYTVHAFPCRKTSQCYLIIILTTSSSLRVEVCNIKFECFKLECVHLQLSTFCPLGNLSPNSLHLIRECVNEIKVVFLVLEERPRIWEKKGRLWNWESLQVRSWNPERRSRDRKGKCREVFTSGSSWGLSAELIGEAVCLS